jgi:hypothetical protein
MLHRRNCRPGKLPVEFTSGECFSTEVPIVEGLQPTRMEFARGEHGQGGYYSVDGNELRDGPGRRLLRRVIQGAGPRSELITCADSDLRAPPVQVAQRVRLLSVSR